MTEELLLEAFRELFEDESITLEDNFYDLGGHSILLLRLAAKAVDLFGIEVTVQEVHESPSIRELAKKIDAKVKHAQAG